ncbi:MAG: hypothetical protein NWE78_02690 [Candidatus Bathyarchaeota archaeon]|nr:hypothetical protein [Candidatus Bathyarchaeota archaeon]
MTREQYVEMKEELA